MRERKSETVKERDRHSKTEIETERKNETVRGREKERMRERRLIYIVGEMSREEEIKAQRGDVEKKTLTSLDYWEGRQDVTESE